MSSNSERFVAYYRVSTKMQGIDGYGIEAQKAAVADFLQGKEVVADFCEVESGRNNSRIELEQAIHLCVTGGYTLIVAKLDRLGRNAAYLFAIRDRVKRLICCDKPNMSTVEFGIYASMAQDEAEKISARTKASLKAREAKTGLRNGNKKGVSLAAAHAKSGYARKERAKMDENQSIASGIIRQELAQGKSLRQIAAYLNAIPITTPKGKSYCAASVARLIKLYEIKKTE